MAEMTLNINGQARVVDVEPDTPLLWVLRDDLNLVGTKYGCGIGACGSCTVLVDGKAMRACLTRASSVRSAEVVTIEGLDAKGMHPVQQAWIEEDVAQCGYCQAGQILTAVALLDEKPQPSDQDIDTAMAGVLCRCGTYTRIRKAIHRAAQIAGADGRHE